MAEGLADGHIHAPPEIKSPRDGFKGRMEVTEERISELEDRTLEITQSGQQETDWKKVSRPSGTYRNIMEDLTFVSSESQRERRKDGGAEKGTEEIMAENVLDLARDIKL